MAMHESGHAVAAIELNFDFIELSIAPPQKVFAQLVDGKAVVGSGVVMPTDQPAEWAGPRPEDALVYVLAGSLAEHRFLGHYLDGGYRGDLDIWRRGTGRLEAQTSEISRVLRDGEDGAMSLLEEHHDAILRVYNIIVERIRAMQVPGLAFTKPLVLSRGEVLEAVIGHS